MGLDRIDDGEPECVFVSGGWDTQDSRAECDFSCGFFWYECVRVDLRWMTTCRRPRFLTWRVQ